MGTTYVVCIEPAHHLAILVPQMRPRVKNAYNTVLKTYYDQHVSIDKEEKKKMDDIYISLKIDIKNYLELPFTIGGLIDRGSNPEELKVIKQDEYDLLVKLNVSGSYWTSQVHEEDSRYMSIKARGKDPNVPANLIKDGKLSAAHVRNNFHSAVQKYVSNYNRRNNLKLALSTHGPAKTLHVKDVSGKQLFDVDLVPLVKLGKNWLIGKPHDKAKNMQPDVPEGCLWRRSFTHRESHALKCIPKGDREILKIVKTMRHYNDKQMGMLSTYVYKTAFLRWYNHDSKSVPDFKALSMWTKLVMYFAYVADTLRKERLYPYFDQDNLDNLLDKRKESALSNLAQYCHKMVDDVNFLESQLSVKAISTYSSFDEIETKHNRFLSVY
ncbi:hypothetical protein CAPTEDRAFT_196697 [Capitella teleta]|uniref:Mab-21-like nucleotidyltransferase domain-containing protein n=1 Tax=Capitella teleta TaxID=283909 RepID=R7TGG4_CAPTE|nr:hypothetical protein CAPTEDRAFT_196697 [Capitella teleta]|eukprot:ELT92868.1 hypothetical protein CAPTEDRAFT_196697 [Capitella teleta]